MAEDATFIILETPDGWRVYADAVYLAAFDRRDRAFEAVGAIVEARCLTGQRSRIVEQSRKGVWQTPCRCYAERGLGPSSDLGSDAI